MSLEAFIVREIQKTIVQIFQEYGVELGVLQRYDLARDGALLTDVDGKQFEIKIRRIDT